MGNRSRQASLTRSRGRSAALLAAWSIALLTLAGGVAFAGDGGIGPGDGGGGGGGGGDVEGPPPPACDGSSSSSEDFTLQDRNATPDIKYYSDGRKATLSYEIGGASQPVDVAVHVQNRDTGETVRSYCPSDVPPGQEQTVQWDTKDESGESAPKGNYKFLVTKPDGSEVDDSAATGEARFQYRGHIFPLHGTPHYYGDGWGAGRGHRGQDLFEDGFPSPCGAPILAARAGTVTYKRRNAGAAGNYIVVDGKKTSHSYAYLHLKGNTFGDFVSKGATVKTGQQIATMGSSGNASACHLHFELWNGPWSQYDPEPSLRKWDQWS